jgi:type IV secretion system protein TrbL
MIAIVGGIAVHPHVAHAQVLNALETTVEGATGGWLGRAIGVAQAIFLVLVGWTIMYNIVYYYVAFETVRGMFGVISRTVLSVAIPWLVLFQWAPTSVATVIGWATNIGNDIVGGTAPPPTPDNVVILGINIGWGLLQKSFVAVQTSHFQFSVLTAASDLGYDATQMFVDVIFVLAAFLLCIVMIAAFTFIAVELVMAFLNAYFVLPLGAWTLGFTATPGTAGIGMSWWTALIQVSVRFIAILAAVSFAQNIGLQWQAQLAAIVPNWNQLPNGGGGTPPPIDIGALKTMISMALGACALLYLVMNLPRLASSIISGAPVLSGAGVVTGASVGVAALAGGAAGMAAGPALGAMGGLARGGPAGMIKGAASGFQNGAGQGAQAGMRAARTMNRSINGMRGG